MVFLIKRSMLLILLLIMGLYIILGGVSDDIRNEIREAHPIYSEIEDPENIDVLDTVL